MGVFKHQWVSMCGQWAAGGPWDLAGYMALAPPPSPCFLASSHGHRPFCGKRAALATRNCCLEAKRSGTKGPLPGAGPT